MQPEIWRSFGAEELAREYSPSSMVDSIEAELATYAGASAIVRERLPFAEYRYGRGARHRLDVFAPESMSPAPLLVFIHGGYWQEERKENACAPAPDVLAAGAGYAAIEYTLAPDASLAAIVEECRTAYGWLVDHAVDLGFDPTRIHVAGSSAGAHLAAMLVLTDWAARGYAATPIASATLLSGIYDLRPLVGTYVNDPLGLDAEAAWALSPMALLAPSPVPLIVTWAEAETTEFKRQGRDFAAAWRARGNACETIADVPARNHFDLPLDLATPASPLGRAVLARVCG